MDSSYFQLNTRRVFRNKFLYLVLKQSKAN